MTATRSPAGVRQNAKRALSRLAYEVASRGGGEREPALMNYGYAAPDDGPPADPEQFARQLYTRVADGADIRGRDVLEVGCGRGGGTAFVFGQHGPRAMTGLDLAQSAIARCRKTYPIPGLTFTRGDAENLPFAPESFDIVLNVESSHCYPSVPRFLDSVKRVLRRDGMLLLADFRHSALSETTEKAILPQEDVACLRRQISDAGFEIVEEEDLTSGVFRSLTLDSPNRRARLERRVPRPLRHRALSLAAVEGGAMYQAFEQGYWTYLRFALRKP